MTNTGISARTYLTDRTNELYVLKRIMSLAERYGVVRVGRFLPGDSGSYAGVYVVRDLGHELVVHTAALVDDRGDDHELTFFSGTYFERGDLEMATRNMNAR